MEDYLEQIQALGVSVLGQVQPYLLLLSWNGVTPQFSVPTSDVRSSKVDLQNLLMT